jgi:hypothetical protein
VPPVVIDLVVHFVFFPYPVMPVVKWNLFLLALGVQMVHDCVDLSLRIFFGYFDFYG